MLAVIAGLVSRDIVLALTLLVIGCPGALVISIPVAIVAGIGRAARNGILIKGGEYLETSAKISTVAVDKTGTLTEGRPELTDVIVLDPSVVAQGCASGTGPRPPRPAPNTPWPAPIIDAAENAGVGLRPASPDDTTPVTGKGIVTQVDGQTVLVGNARTDGAVRPAVAQIDGASGSRITGRSRTDPDDRGRGRHRCRNHRVADQIRRTPPEMVTRLHEAGVHNVVMLTGDTRLVAEAVAGATGIDQVHASLLPEDKLTAVQKLQSSGDVVAMVGDGVNDAPALATADIGVAMGAAGSDVAMETADIALMEDDLLKLPEAVGLARRTGRVMRQNIIIALATVILLLAGVFAGGVTMSLGMLVHEASVLVVIANAMRLMRARAR